MGERRSFLTHAGAGGVESDALGLPFKSTPCEDWYGFGDSRCPSRYIETGDLETDIISLKKWIGYYSLRGKSGYNLEDKLGIKQAEFDEMQRQRAWLQLSDEEQQRQQRLLQVNEMIATSNSELSELQKTLAGFHPQHYIRGSIETKIIQLQEKIKQLQTVKERLAREEIIRTTAKPKETVIVPPEIVEDAFKYFPLALAGIGIIVFIIILRRRA